MNVTLLAPGDYPNGLAELRMISRELARHGVRATVICRVDSSRGATSVDEPARVITIPASGLAFTVQAASHLRRLRPDLVHVYAYRGCALLPSLAPGPRYLLDVRTGNVTGRPWARLADRLTRLQALRFDGVAVISRAVAKYVGGDLWNNAFVFPVTFSEAAMSKARAARRTTPDAPLRIGYAGSLEPQRCPDRLVEIARLLRQRNIPCRWIVVGDGRARPRIEQLASATGLKPLMDFRGKVPSDQMWQHYADMDLTLSYVPVRAHYFNQPPLKTIEAMAAGLPTVATDTQGNRDLVANADVAILAPDDVHALANALERLVGDEALRRKLGEQAVVASQPFAIERIVSERVVPAYQQLIDGSISRSQLPDEERP